MAGVRKDQWDKLINDVFRILKPGSGWAQCTEPTLALWDDGDVPASSPYAQVSPRKERVNGCFAACCLNTLNPDSSSLEAIIYNNAL